MSAAPPAPALVTVEDALRGLLDRLSATDAEQVPLAAALGRVVAADVVGRWRIPGCDNSAMDGYAVRSADCAGAGVRPGAEVRLPLVGEARAGSPPAVLAPGTAMAIATGAAVPLGADAVVPVEEAPRRGRDVIIGAPVRAGSYVRLAGHDAEPGGVAVAAGQRLRAVDIAAVAAAGLDSVAVHRRPRVALLGGGDELVAAGVEPAPYQVTDSNTPMLMAAVIEAGGEPLLMGVMGDDRGSVRRHVLAAAGCDLVVSSAGVSVGAHDHVRSVVEELGTVDVWRVAMRPGKPLLLGDVRGTPLLGLPGNPASSAVTFELFGRPAILALQGATRVRRRRIAVRLGQDVVTQRGLETYLRVRLEDGADGVPVATLSGDQASSMLHSLSGADALLAMEAGSGGGAAGTIQAALELT